jgi:hypothetical protein
MITPNFNQDTAYFATVLKGKNNKIAYCDLTLDYLCKHHSFHVLAG